MLEIAIIGDSTSQFYSKLNKLIYDIKNTFNEEEIVLYTIGYSGSEFSKSIHKIATEFDIPVVLRIINKKFGRGRQSRLMKQCCDDIHFFVFCDVTEPLQQSILTYCEQENKTIQHYKLK